MSRICEGRCTNWAFLFPRLLGNESVQAQECCRKGEACCRTATESELFCYLTCYHTTTFVLLSIFSLVETISLQIWGGPSVLAREVVTSFCPWLKNIAFLSSLLSVGRTAIVRAKCKSRSRDLARVFPWSYLLACGPIKVIMVISSNLTDNQYLVRPVF